MNQTIINVLSAYEILKMSKRKDIKDFNSVALIAPGSNDYISLNRIKDRKRDWLKRITQNKKK